ncbi:hypothetical protein JL720_15035 [Aureococcus anophagefferens]|nr:hypothetical protein JL720_15035 [Aureococcus anophagefferens]
MFCQNLWWLGALPLGARAFYTSDMYHGWKKPEASDGAKVTTATAPGSTTSYYVLDLGQDDGGLLRALDLDGSEASLLASLDESEQSLLASLASPAAEPAVAALVEAIGEDGGLVEAIGGSVFHAPAQEAHETAAGVCVFASGSAQIDGWYARQEGLVFDGAFLKTTLGNVARPTVAAVLALEACRRCLFATFWKAVAWGLGELGGSEALLRKLAVEEALGGLALCAVAACETSFASGAPIRGHDALGSSGGRRRAVAVALASTAWIVRLAYAHGGATAALQAVALALRTAKRTTQALLHGASLALAAGRLFGMLARYHVDDAFGTADGEVLKRRFAAARRRAARLRADDQRFRVASCGVEFCADVAEMAFILACSARAARARLAYHREWAPLATRPRSLFAPADDDAVRAYDDICVICHDGFAVAARDNGAGLGAPAGRSDFSVK